jgi:hypothetical protein
MTPFDAGKIWEGVDLMILGMSVATFTVLHTAISLIGIAAGLMVLGGLFGGQRMPVLTAVFLGATVLTSITGFMFPLKTIGPPHVVGAISLAVLAAALAALYVYRLAGSWRWVYVAAAVLSLYLNVFVGVVQAFQKLPFLTPLAPTQAEPPFLIAQIIVLAAFVIFGLVAVKKFHPELAVQN